MCLENLEDKPTPVIILFGSKVSQFPLILRHWLINASKITTVAHIPTVNESGMG